MLKLTRAARVSDSLARNMTLLRITGAIWLCVAIAGIAHGISSLDLDLWVPALLASLFCGIAGVLGLSLLLRRLWAVWPLCAQASLVLLIALVEMCPDPLDSDWTLWCALLLSSWTIALSVVLRILKKANPTVQPTGASRSGQETNRTSPAAGSGR